MSKVVISTENLHKFYGTRAQQVHALKGVDISIEKGTAIEQGTAIGGIIFDGIGKVVAIDIVSGQCDGQVIIFIAGDGLGGGGWRIIDG